MSNNNFSNMTTNDRAALAAQVKRVRVEMGLTQAQLATEAKVTRQSIGNLESGGTIPQSKTIESVLKVLNIVPSKANFSEETERWLGIIGGIMDSLPMDRRPAAGQAAVSAVTNELVASSNVGGVTEDATYKKNEVALAAKERSKNRGEITYD